MDEQDVQDQEMNGLYPVHPVNPCSILPRNLAALLRIPGFAEHRELQLMVNAGLSPSQAITTATHNAAELLGLHDRGVLAAANLADFVVLDADPLSDIRNTEKIAVGWHRGRMLSGAVEGPKESNRKQKRRPAQGHHLAFNRKSILPARAAG